MCQRLAVFINDSIVNPPPYNALPIPFPLLNDEQCTKWAMSALDATFQPSTVTPTQQVLNFMAGLLENPYTQNAINWSQQDVPTLWNRLVNPGSNGAFSPISILANSDLDPGEYFSFSNDFSGIVQKGGGISFVVDGVTGIQLIKGDGFVLGQDSSGSTLKSYTHLGDITTLVTDSNGNSNLFYVDGFGALQ